MPVHDRVIPTIFVVPLINVIVGGVLFVSLLYGQRELTVLALLVLSMVGGTKLWSSMSLKGLNCRLTVNRSRMFPDEKLLISITAENIKLLPVWLQLKVPVGTALHSSPDEKVLEKEGSLLWYQKADFQWELTARRRGLHHVGPLHFFAGDLFAFFHQRKKVEGVHQILVYPRLVPLTTFSLPRHDFFGSPGSKSPVLDPAYILGTRDYQYGQSSKYIHWKASARHDRLQEKVLEPTKQEKVLIAVDVEQFARRGAREGFERTLEVAASLAARLDRGGHAVGLVTNGVIAGGGLHVVPVARNHRQLSAILEVLARLKMNPRMSLTDMLRRGFDLTWGLSCVHFSCESDGNVLAAKQYFTDRKTPVIFFVSRFSPEKDRSYFRHQIRSLDDICVPKRDE